MAGSLSILTVAHSLVVPSNRARWERLAEKYPDADITIITPNTFVERRYGKPQRHSVAPMATGNYRVVPIAITSKRGIYRSIGLRLRQSRPDVVQVNEEPTEWPLLQTFLTARALAPNALRFFYEYTNVLAPPASAQVRGRMRTIFKLADGAFAGSRAAQQVLRDLGMTRPIHLQTELGADERVWRPPTDRGKQPFTVGFVGALIPEKGVVDLARAVCSLEGDWKLVVVGSGVEQATITRELAFRGLGNRLDLRGLVARDDLPGITRQMDTLVLPSRTTRTWVEQFGLVLVEAMLSGVAVIGSDSGAIPEVIGDAGIVFPEGDVTALAAALRSLQTQPAKREALAERGRQRALAKYSATALADETYALYREMLDERTSGSRR